jgi:hypothetical protein
MNELLQQLHQARTEADIDAAAIKKLEDDLKVSEIYKTFAEALAYQKKQIELLTAAAKDEALLDYGVNGSKKMHDGAVNIKVFEDIGLVYDADKAKVWATENAPALIVLDVKKFEKHVLAVADTVPVPGVVIKRSDRIEAQIASDLTKYMPK